MDALEWIAIALIVMLLISETKGVLERWRLMREHREERERADNAWRERIDKLLDRVMANSLTEFKHLETASRPRVSNPMRGIFTEDTDEVRQE